MTFENNSDTDDLEQIVRHQMSSLIALEALKTSDPDHAADFAAIQEKSQEILDDIEEIATRARKKAAEMFEE